MVGLRAFETFLPILTVYNSIDFAGKKQPTKLQNFVQTFGFSVFFSALLVTCFAAIGCLAGIVCFGGDAPWDRKALTLSVSISSFRTVFIYMAVVLKNEKIFQTIDHLQHIMELRKFFLLRNYQNR